MAYRLEQGEPAPSAVRRIASEVLDGALHAAGGEDGEDGEGGEGDGGERIHTIRTSIKRARALLRLIRPEIGDEVFNRENDALRDIGHSLSGVRDAAVLVDAFESVTEKDAAGDPGAARVRAALLERREAESARGMDAEALGGRLVEVKRRVEVWPLHEGGWGAFEPGLAAAYRGARKRLRDARRERRDDALHDLRKRVKDLTYLTGLLGPIRPARMKDLERSLKKLGDRLGEHHDLSVLREVTASLLPAGDPARDGLLAHIDARRDALAKKALRRAEQILDERPKRFTGRLARWFRRWERDGRGAAVK
jgi:CHAD domain-containing protein